MTVIPGLALAMILAAAGQYLSGWIGVSLMGLPKSPISAIMMAIILGILVRNTIRLPDTLQPGIRFGLVRILRLGIVLLGIRMSLVDAAGIGLQSLPVIVSVITLALLLVTYLSRKAGLGGTTGTLIAVGTSICGATAIVAIAPAIGARDDEVSYSVACITLFGVIAMLVYPFAAHWFFSGDSFSSGLFLGTAVHDTSQVVGAGLVYQEYYDDPNVLNVATVAKLVRNLGMLIIIPLMSILYHRGSADRGFVPNWWTMVPLFVVGFALMSLLRTIGDMSLDSGSLVFGILEPKQWVGFIAFTKAFADTCLAVAMSAVGLGTGIRGILSIGPKPLAIGLFSALLVGAGSATLISLYY